MPQNYANENNLTLKTLERLNGRISVSKQYISDLSNTKDLKKAEREIIQKVLQEFPDGKINVKEFEDKVKRELLSLKIRRTSFAHHDNVVLPAHLRGNIAKYSEHFYSSPVRSTAEFTHFSGFGVYGKNNYFAHSRIEDMEGNKTRRVLEIQSDLFQNGRIEIEEFTQGELNFEEAKKALEDGKEVRPVMDFMGDHDIGKPIKTLKELSNAKTNEFAVRKEIPDFHKLLQYRRCWHERIIQEEIRKAAKDGKSHLQFPTSETAMKIQNIGNIWTSKIEDITLPINEEWLQEKGIGTTVFRVNERWIITELLGEGKFRAVPKRESCLRIMPPQPLTGREQPRQADYDLREKYKESFDVADIRLNYQVQKFYKKNVQKCLLKLGGNRVTDEKGLSWIEVQISKELAKMPIMAFGVKEIEKETDVQKERMQDLKNIREEKEIGKRNIERNL
jgi:hypothetical protein